jgi:hypothetical protein
MYEKNERNLFIRDTLKISDMPEPVGKMYLTWSYAEHSVGVRDVTCETGNFFFDSPAPHHP